jgi:hypothetical protein
MHAFSQGAGESDSFCKLLIEMLGTFEAFESNSLRLQLLTGEGVPLQIHTHTPTPEREALEELYEILISDKKHAYAWEGDTQLRLKAAKGLHDLLHPYVYDEPLFCGISHWLLTTPFQVPGAGDSALPDELRERFRENIQRYPMRSLEACCNMITSSALSGLPPAINDDLLEPMKKCVDIQEIEPVKHALDRLFQYFLHQEHLGPEHSYGNPDYEAQQRTLTSLIEFTIQMRQAHPGDAEWESLLKSWLTSIEEKEVKFRAQVEQLKPKEPEELPEDPNQEEPQKVEEPLDEKSQAELQKAMECVQAHQNLASAIKHELGLKDDLLAEEGSPGTQYSEPNRTDSDNTYVANDP